MSNNNSGNSWQLVVLAVIVLSALGWRIRTLVVNLGIFEVEFEYSGSPTRAPVAVPEIPVQPEEGEYDLERTPPDAAVIDYYYSLINGRQYEVAWSKLSDHFKSIKNCCTADGEYDYHGYTKWWDSVSEVQIHKIEVVYETATTARLILDISYARYSTPTYRDPNFQVDLVWDTASQRWMFYDTTSLE